MAETKWGYALSVERELKHELKSSGPSFADIDTLIVELRRVSQETVFLDFDYAIRENVESHLWDAHTLINARYRKMTQYYLKVEKDKKVEKRKLEKRYADFLKTSQFFYKGYIQRLASHFAGMTELRRIAHRLDLSTSSVDPQVQVSSQSAHMIEMCCHATLLHLGDLSRYRNAIRTKDRSWAAALGYYALAGDLYPNSGSSHNQMAVIALEDSNHLDALYHLYCAIAVQEPHPLAKKNLEVEFKKISTAWETGAKSKNDSEGTLILWFVRLHAKLYKGEEFSTHDELENEVLSRLALLLKEQSFEDTLEKFVLTNIAAQYLAAERVQEEESDTSIQSFYWFLRLNVRMLFIFLRTLQPELEDPITGEDLPSSVDGAQQAKAYEKITVITRRLLPAIRQYSIWLTSQTDILVAYHPDEAAVSVHIKELWKMYADVLTGLINLFPVGELPILNYLLEEDQTTVGFKPLRAPKQNSNFDLYIDSQGNMKLRNTDQGVHRSHPNVEMQARVRDILLCGLALAIREDCPIALDQASSRFAYVEEGVQHVSPITVHTAVPSASSHTSPTHASSKFTTPDFGEQQGAQGMPEGSVAASDSQQSMDTKMNRMVDDLLKPSNGIYSASNETSYGMRSQTANEIFGYVNANPQYTQSTPKMPPALPTIWNSAFTPRPNELQATSPDRPATARQVSPLQLSTPQQQKHAAVALDQLTRNYESSKKTWARDALRSDSQNVNSLLQQSLARQFNPASNSSAFTNSSSIYENSTPRYAENRRLGGALRTGQAGFMNGNNTTIYEGASDFDKTTLLQSSLWNGTQSSYGHGTPPGGQGG